MVNAFLRWKLLKVSVVPGQNQMDPNVSQESDEEGYLDLDVWLQQLASVDVTESQESQTHSLETVGDDTTHSDDRGLKSKF